MARPNIICIVMDTARASSVLPSENPGVMSNLEEIATKGITFRNAISTAPWTLPSHASLFTGQYTSDHQTHAGSKDFSPTEPPLAEQLHRSGYQTVCISNNVWVSPNFGFDRGFEDFYTGIEPISGGAKLGDIAKSNSIRTQTKKLVDRLSVSNAIPTLLNTFYAQHIHKKYDYGALVTNWRIKRWLDRSRDDSRPFFMFVNYLEPHLDYNPPKKFMYEYLPDNLSKSDLDGVNQDAWKFVGDGINMTNKDFDALEALYNAELSYLDYRLGNLFESLKESIDLDNTLLIITADHGENIGEHGLMDHQYSLYDTVTRVPLFIRYPQKVVESKCNSNVVELRQIYPTILSFADIDGYEDPSNPVLPIHQGTSESSREYAMSEYVVPQPSITDLAEAADVSLSGLKKYDRGIRSIRTSSWKFIEGTDETEELYHIESDPSEEENLINRRPEIANELRGKLHSERGKQLTVDDSIYDINKNTEKRLEKLGYI